MFATFRPNFFHMNGLDQGVTTASLYIDQPLEVAGMDTACF